MKRRKLTLSTAFAAVVLASAGWLLTPGTAEADNQWYIYTRSGQEVCKRAQAATLPWGVWTGFPSVKM